MVVEAVFGEGLLVHFEDVHHAALDLGLLLPEPADNEHLKGPLVHGFDHFPGGHHNAASKGKGLVLLERVVLQAHFGEELSELDHVLDDLGTGLRKRSLVLGLKLVRGKQNALANEVLDYVVGRHEVQLPVQGLQHILLHIDEFVVGEGRLDYRVEFHDARVGFLLELGTDEHADYCHELHNLLRGLVLSQLQGVQMVVDAGQGVVVVEQANAVVDGLRLELQVLSHLAHPVHHDPPLLHIAC